jgi:hypothetical protein
LVHINPTLSLAPDVQRKPAAAEAQIHGFQLLDPVRDVLRRHG